MRKVWRTLIDLLAVVIIGYFFYLGAWFVVATSDDGMARFFATPEQKRDLAFVMLGMILPVVFCILWGVFRIVGLLKVPRYPFGENFRANVPLRFLLAIGGAMLLCVFVSFLAGLISAHGS